MKKILLLGGGGHCASVADTLLRLNEYDDIGVIANDTTELLFGSIPVVGCDGDLQQLFKDGYHYAFIAIGSIGNTAVREKLKKKVREIGFIMPNIIDPSAIISKNSSLGTGIFIGKNVVVNARATIGDCAIINTAAVVEHDCKIGSFAHISPSATLCGNVIVGASTHIGAGAVIKQGLNIGTHTIIGMGSVVLNDIGDNVVAYGNPCIEVHCR